ncbi:hypothetical protein BRC97_00795 [Halobacteriales archaeon QS_6_71_20]|nr:MAG: hypothetical protein BRC97_00795 [Halobacteriales archaeon QS_6_71_20]
MHRDGNRSARNRGVHLRFHLLVGSLAVASLAYVLFDAGTAVSDAAEILVPVTVSGALVLLAVRISDERAAPGRVDRIVTYGWVGAAVAGSVAASWAFLRLLRQVPVGPHADRLLTVVSLGIGVGVAVGAVSSEGTESEDPVPSRRDADRRPGPGTERERRTDRSGLLTESTWTERAGPDPAVGAVVDVLAELDGVDPLELDPLYESVDLEALSLLRERDGAQWQLVFYVDDYEIRVGSQGTVTALAADPSAHGRDERRY